METSVGYDTFHNLKVLRFRFPCKSNSHFSTGSVKKEKKRGSKYYGFPSFPAVDNAIAFGSFKLAATASSNHLQNCKITNSLFMI